MDDQQTYYQILRLERAATFDQIKTARARMLRLYHPDLHPKASEWEKEEFNRLTKRANEAYSVLSDSSERAAYDKKLDEDIYKATSNANPYSEPYTQSYGASQSHQGQGSTRNERRRRRQFSDKHPEYGRFNANELNQLYSDAKSWVIRDEIHTAKDLKTYLGRLVTSRDTLDSLTADFLDELCKERVLKRRVGETGRTTYAFCGPDAGDDYEDEDEHGGEADSNAPDSDAYEETPVENGQQEMPKRPRRKRSNRWVGVVFWLVIAGWAWHYFASQPATTEPETPTAFGVPLRNDLMTKPGAAQTAESSGAVQGDASASLQTSLTSSASAPAPEAPIVPLQNLETTASQHGEGANASTADTQLQQPLSPSAASPPDWLVVHEVPPTYPIAALRLGEAGTTIVEVRLDANGRIVDAQVRKSSGYHDLDKAAVEAVRKFQFAPVGGKATNSGGTVLVPVVFRQQ